MPRHSDGTGAIRQREVQIMHERRACPGLPRRLDNVAITTFAGLRTVRSSNDQQSKASA